MKKEIQQIIQQAIKSAYGVDFDAEKIKVDYPNREILPQEVPVELKESFYAADYYTNVAMILTKELGKKSEDIAEEICREIKTENKLLFAQQYMNTGFINIYLKLSSVLEGVRSINIKGAEYGKITVGANKKIHLDFVSANPTGPVHIGNARGGPLGDTLANVFEKAGYKTFREYYVNDVGNQVEILGHSILGDEEAQYKGGYIEELKEKLSFEESSLSREAGGKSLALKGKDVRKIGEEGVKIILEEITKPSMEKFGIKFDNYFSEKELQESGKVDEVINVLREKDFIYEKEGALWFKSTQFGDDKDRVVQKSMGEKTYFGSDIAYHREKLDRGFDKLIDIWGADHHGDVVRMKGAMEALEYKDKLDIILTQFVRVLKGGKEMKMSKRAGTYVSVDDLIDEVGRDATRFFFLLHSAEAHMNFDLDLAKEKSEKNPVYYVQYAHARISSILEKAKETEEKVKKIDTSKLLEEYWGGEDKNKAQRVKERALMFELLKFPDLVEEISQNYAVHHLPQYAIGLADKFHSFYDECRVIDESNLELTARRLELVKAVKIVLAETLRLMGISAPEKM